MAETRRTFGLAGPGAAVLGLRKRPQWVAPWVALVVGVHFVPLAFVLRDAGLFVLAAPVVATAVEGFAARRITPSAVTGAAAGAALLLFAGRAAVLVRSG